MNISLHFRFTNLIFPAAFVMFHVSACAGSGNSIKTADATLTAFTSTGKAKQTEVMDVPLPVNSSPPISVLQAFPLAEGARWTYSAEISYMDLNDSSRLEKWSGTITRTVIAEETISNQEVIFTLQQEMDPLPPDQVWQRSGVTIKYRIVGNQVFSGNSKILEWPLSDGQEWDWVSSSVYKMRANSVQNVEVPYGKYTSGCYRIFLTTLPDATSDVFCPSTGFVEHSYNHHGTPQIEEFVLTSFDPGK